MSILRKTRSIIHKLGSFIPKKHHTPIFNDLDKTLGEIRQKNEEEDTPINNHIVDHDREFVTSLQKESEKGNE